MDTHDQQTRCLCPVSPLCAVGMALKYYSYSIRHDPFYMVTYCQNLTILWGKPMKSLLVLILILMPSISLSADWVFYAFTDDYVSFYDEESIATKGNDVITLSVKHLDYNKVKNLILRMENKVLLEESINKKESGYMPKIFNYDRLYMKEYEIRYPSVVFFEIIIEKNLMPAKATMLMNLFCKEDRIVVRSVIETDDSGKNIQHKTNNNLFIDPDFVMKNMFDYICDTKKSN
jgi:hypothetical protein